jgi:hypothetical protein
VAKKVRTPLPPKRPVQAPQRRDTKRRGPVDGRRKLWPIVAVLCLVAVAGIAAALYFALRGNGNDSSPGATPSTGTVASSNPYNKLPGVRRTKPPWPVDYTHLTDNLAALQLGVGTSHNGLVTHFHDHLDVFVDGQKVVVPALIGINDNAYLTELHTHDASGIIHVETTESGKTFKLGQFFAEWPVFLSSNCIGSECGLVWYLNGKRQTGDPAQLVLKPHQVIVMVLGRAPKKIPSTYPWKGL